MDSLWDGNTELSTAPRSVPSHRLLLLSLDVQYRYRYCRQTLRCCSLKPSKVVFYTDSLHILPSNPLTIASYIPSTLQGSVLIPYVMTRRCSLRQLLFCFFGIFCLLMILLIEAVLHYRLQTSGPRPPTGTLRSLQHLLPGVTDPVTTAAPGILHKPKTQHPPLTAPGSNYGLSHTECRTEFPGLFDELDRSAALRRDLGNVSRADIDMSWKPYGAVRVMIYNHKVIFIPDRLGL